jgi:Domain of unknown function (DUF4186)
MADTKVDEIDLDEEPPPLQKMSCTRTDCANGLHCFLPNRSMARKKQKGPCRSCGKEMVDFSRLEKRNLADVSNTIEMLKMEWIRHEYWCSKPIDQETETNARRSGLRQLLVEAESSIRERVGSPRHPVQGRQTPWDGNIIYYAQHATACCCRRCIEVWYGISRKRNLTEEEIRYFTELVSIYIRYRLPDLTEAGEPGWSREGEALPKKSIRPKG